MVSINDGKPEYCQICKSDLNDEFIIICSKEDTDHVKFVCRYCSQVIIDSKTMDKDCILKESVRIREMENI